MGETEHKNAFKFIIRLRSYTRLQKGGNAGNVFPANLRFFAVILADDLRTFVAKKTLSYLT